MAGVTPLLNAQFVNSVSGVAFNGQGVTGTGGSTLRQFGHIFDFSGARGLSPSDLWYIIIMASGSGNHRIDLPNDLSASPGDEIILMSTTGTITVNAISTTIINSNGTATTKPGKSLKLIYIGSNTWFSVSTNTPYYSHPIVDCCGNMLNGGNVWQFNESTPTSGAVFYSDYYGGALYTRDSGATAISNVVKIGSLGSEITGNVTSGNFTSNTCDTKNWSIGYTFYSVFGGTHTFYSSSTLISIYDDTEVASIRWKTTNYTDYSCSSSYDVAPGTSQLYYRYYDMIYGASYPVCFLDGIATRFDGLCP